MTPEQGDERRAAIRGRLRLDDWLMWSRTAAPRLARKLGVGIDEAEAALAELVLDRVGEMLEALA